MAKRPERMRMHGDVQTLTLPSGPSQYARLDTPDFRDAGAPGKRVLLLGLGPDPADAAQLIPDHASGPDYVEAPAFLGQVDDTWRERIPSSWRERDFSWAAGLDSQELKHAIILYYSFGGKLFPSFWSPLLAKVRAALHDQGGPRARPKRIILPGEPQALLLPELSHALSRAGWTVDTPSLARGTFPDPGLLAESLARDPAVLYFSVNGQGLDPLGEVFHQLGEAGCRVALWCVDNPWHILSGFRGPFWRDMLLCVTDHSFIPDLKRQGAAHVLHLPLAADATWFDRDFAAPDMDVAGRAVFVGRSAFPDKQGFFAASTVAPALLAQAQTELAMGKRPDFAWWVRQLDLKTLWPDKAVRTAGLGAEQISLLHRVHCLEHANSHLGLALFGDPGWREHIPNIVDLRTPIDYYAQLPAVYAQAGLCLNMTSLLLPSGLTQRHFDVWAAGGVLATDATPGLSIFPEELTRPISFTLPEELDGATKRLTQDTGLRHDLQARWRELIAAEHTYDVRVKKLLSALDL